MTQLVTITRVKLGAAHHHAGKAKHAWTDSHGTQVLAPFVEIEIMQKPGDSGCYLYRRSTDNMFADTWHQTIQEAVNQAEWEFGVRASEWNLFESRSSK